MRFTRINYANMVMADNTTVKNTYVTLVQNNTYQKVEITPTDCKKSVKYLSKITNRDKD